jgi:hypothetical protein
MGINDYAKIIQNIVDIAAEKKNFDSQKTELFWRLGYLTGLLAHLAESDNYVRDKLKHRLAEVKESRKKKR